MLFFKIKKTGYLLIYYVMKIFLSSKELNNEVLTS